jgi:hypothetical protein
VIVGNEDCPDVIQLYQSADPLYTDSFTEYVLDDGGAYVLSLESV